MRLNKKYFILLQKIHHFSFRCTEVKIEKYHQKIYLVYGSKF